MLLLSPPPPRTLLECRSNQRIRPKTDSRVPKCLIESGDEPNGPGKSQGHCGRIPQILGCSLQHQLAPQPAADTPERYEKASLDPPHTICKPLTEGTCSWWWRAWRRLRRGNSRRRRREQSLSTYPALFLRGGGAANEKQYFVQGAQKNTLILNFNNS